MRITTIINKQISIIGKGPFETEKGIKNINAKGNIIGLNSSIFKPIASAASVSNLESTTLNNTKA